MSRRQKLDEQAALVAQCKRRGLWPFPAGGLVKPMSQRAKKREAMQELAALGPALL